MCSTNAAQLARICRAIEDLAGQPTHPRRADAAGTADSDRRDDAAADPAQGASDDALAARLAAIWAMVAEADPELAKRVPGYLEATD